MSLHVYVFVFFLLTMFVTRISGQLQMPMVPGYVASQVLSGNTGKWTTDTTPTAATSSITDEGPKLTSDTSTVENVDLSTATTEEPMLIQSATSNIPTPPTSPEPETSTDVSNFAEMYTDRQQTVSVFEEEVTTTTTTPAEPPTSTDSSTVTEESQSWWNSFWETGSKTTIAEMDTTTLLPPVADSNEIISDFSTTVPPDTYPLTFADLFSGDPTTTLPELTSTEAAEEETTVASTVFVSSEDPTTESTEESTVSTSESSTMVTFEEATFAFTNTDGTEAPEISTTAFDHFPTFEEVIDEATAVLTAQTETETETSTTSTTSAFLTTSAVDLTTGFAIWIFVGATPLVTQDNSSSGVLGPETSTTGKWSSTTLNHTSWQNSTFSNASAIDTPAILQLRYGLFSLGILLLVIFVGTVVYVCWRKQEGANPMKRIVDSLVVTEPNGESLMTPELPVVEMNNAKDLLAGEIIP